MPSLPICRRAGLCQTLAIAVTLTVVWGLTTGWAQEPASGRFVDRVYTDASGEHKYVVFEPAGYDASKKWPVIFYLHGASGRGSDGRSQLIVGMGPAVQQRAATLPFLVVFPQSDNLRSRLLGGWHEEPAELDRALRILDVVEREYSVDRNHEVLVGISMGAFGAWDLAARDPQRWKAVLAISGGAKDEMIPALAKTPVWAFHALDDALVPPESSSELVGKIRDAGGRAFVSLLPRGGHNIGASVLARDEVFAWMQHPERDPVLDIDWNQRHELPSLIHLLPFVTGAEVSQAVRVHIGRDLLESWAMLMPELVPAESLQGWKPGMTQSTQAGPFTFNVSMSGIQYVGTLEQALISPLPHNRLRLQLGLRSLQMTIGSTHLRGRILSADAGPIHVLIGHRAPVWLTIDVAPQVIDRQLKMNLVGVDFQIPHDNWGISRPSHVHVRGLPFLEDRIGTQLVDGIAEKRATIEAEIRNGVPQMIAQVESRIGEFQNRVMTFHRFPMPLWQPRFKFHPESIAIGEQGLEVTLGARVAQLGQRPPGSQLLQFPKGDEADGVAPLNGLEMAISQRVVTAWSTLLAQSNVGRFHVLDMSAPTFQTLGHREFWHDALPALRSVPAEVELLTEFVLTKPLRLRDRAAGSSGIHPLHHEVLFDVPNLRMDLSLREPGRKEPTPYAQFDVSLSQGLHAAINRPAFNHREFQHELIPADRPEVVVRMLPAGVTVADVNLDLVADQFARGWVDSFSTPGRTAVLKDLAMARLPLRWHEVGWDGAHLVARLRRPGIRVVNGSATALTYQVRGMQTVWGEPLSLAPGEFHEFRPASLLEWKSMQPTNVTPYRVLLGQQIEIGPNGPLTVPPQQAATPIERE
jgi:poly(3-hydroxybutyrate) depolymerase